MSQEGAGLTVKARLVSVMKPDATIVGFTAPRQAW